MSQLLQNNGAVVVSLKTGSADADVTALLGCFFPLSFANFRLSLPSFFVYAAPGVRRSCLRCLSEHSPEQPQHTFTAFLMF